ncbi:unnamed protein product [Penicillium glandicola]
MAEASLAFPAICLTLSFLFVVAVYNASIMQHLCAFHRCTILPTYRKIERMLVNHNPMNQNRPNCMPEAGYNPINLDTKAEDEQHHPPLTTSPMLSPDYHRHDENPNLERPNMFSESGGPHRPRRWATFVGVDENPPPSPLGSTVSSDAYDSDWSNSAVDEAVFEPQPLPGDIPIWEFVLERPVYTVVQEQRGPAAWLDDVVEWTSQGIFAVVAPDIIEQRA